MGPRTKAPSASPRTDRTSCRARAASRETPENGSISRNLRGNHSTRTETEGHNDFTGPHQVRVDFSIYKDFAIREGMRLQFRAESFNLTNTPMFGLPDYDQTDCFRLEFSNAGN